MSLGDVDWSGHEWPQSSQRSRTATNDAKTATFSKVIFRDIGLERLSMVFSSFEVMRPFSLAYNVGINTCFNPLHRYSTRREPFETCASVFPDLIQGAAIFSRVKLARYYSSGP
jgi:hypothetical protein